MRTSKVIHVVSCHAEGEVGDVIVGGVAPPPGDTVWDQRSWIAQDQGLRNFMLNEPRGGVFRHVNLLVPPKTPGADAAWIVMEPEDTPPMSGSNSICVATVLLETGILPMTEPTTTLTLEAPGGIVQVTAQCAGGKVTQVKVENIPSFAAQCDVVLEVAGLGTLTVDTAFGGDSFVLVDAPALGFTVQPDEARDIAEMGMRISDAATEQLGFHHPTNPDWRHISFTQFCMPVQTTDGCATGRNAVAIRPGKLDRSPCGTGVCARMAVMHAKGQMQAGDRFVGKSIIGSTFYGCIERETSVGGVPGIIPSIAGQAWVTGTHQHMLDPSDPWPQGYRLSDTWPRLG